MHFCAGAHAVQQPSGRGECVVRDPLPAAGSAWPGRKWWQCIACASLSRLFVRGLQPWPTSLTEPHWRRNACTGAGAALLRQHTASANGSEVGLRCAAQPSIGCHCWMSLLNVLPAPESCALLAGLISGLLPWLAGRPELAWQPSSSEQARREGCADAPGIGARLAVIGLILHERAEQLALPSQQGISCFAALPATGSSGFLGDRPASATAQLCAGR